MQNRLAEVFAQLSEFFDEWNQRPVVDAVDAADKLQVVQPSQVGLKGASEGQWPRHSHSATNHSGCRTLRAGQQANQRRFAGAVTPQNTEMSAPLQFKADVLENMVSSLPSRIRLGDMFDGQHQNSTLRPASRCR